LFGINKNAVFGFIFYFAHAPIRHYFPKAIGYSIIYELTPFLLHQSKKSIYFCYF